MTHFIHDVDPETTDQTPEQTLSAPGLFIGLVVGGIVFLLAFCVALICKLGWMGSLITAAFAAASCGGGVYKFIKT